VYAPTCNSSFFGPEIVPIRCPTVSTAPHRFSASTLPVDPVAGVLNPAPDENSNCPTPQEDAVSRTGPSGQSSVSRATGSGATETVGTGNRPGGPATGSAWGRCGPAKVTGRGGPRHHLAGSVATVVMNAINASFSSPTAPAETGSSSQLDKHRTSHTSAGKCHVLDTASLSGGLAWRVSGSSGLLVQQTSGPCAGSCSGQPALASVTANPYGIELSCGFGTTSSSLASKQLHLPPIQPVVGWANLRSHAEAIGEARLLHSVSPLAIWRQALLKVYSLGL
ncbi:unnamed protein product, partial [Protopolystoma xenopodis]